MRSEVSQSGVFPFEVVVGDEVADDATSSSLMVILGHFEFSLERSETRFHKSVVVAVVRSGHALPKLRSSQNSPVAMASILASAIRVMNQSRRCLSLPNSTKEHSTTRLSSMLFSRCQLTIRLEKRSIGMARKQNAPPRSGMYEIPPTHS